MENKDYKLISNFTTRGRVLEEVEVENKAVLDDSTTGLNLSQYTTHPVTANEQPDRPSSQVSSSMFI